MIVDTVKDIPSTVLTFAQIEFSDYGSRPIPFALRGDVSIEV
jgi:hypothetical protein